MILQANKKIALISTVILMMCLTACVMLGCSGSSKKADTNLKEQSEPSNGAILAGSSSGDASVEVTASSGHSTYVKVKSSSGKTVVGMYVRAGSTAQAKVPSGTYSIQFASGDKWYGQNDYFGNKTTYGQDKSVSVGSGEAISYKLQLSSGGNFSMDSLNGSDF